MNRLTPTQNRSRSRVASLYGLHLAFKIMFVGSTSREGNSSFTEIKEHGFHYMFPPSFKRLLTSVYYYIDYMYLLGQMWWPSMQKISKGILRFHWKKMRYHVFRKAPGSKHLFICDSQASNLSRGVLYVMPLPEVRFR